ncbi:MAG: hypothetical protein DCC75_06265 [Proteobacteria bacterium]|nr:MAG: hypothetical protein DCC75_06265 [Pseudomonadota bacterium]
MAPMLGLLPNVGSISMLTANEASLFARLEKVEKFRQELGSQHDSALWKRLSAEAEMLRCVLDWIAQRKEAPL